METSLIQERRQHARFGLELASKLTVGSSPTLNVFETQTRNVSSGGAFFHLSEHISEGTRVNLRLTLATERLKDLTGKQGLVEVGGQVVRCNRTGVAIRFDKDYYIGSADVYKV